MRINKMKIVKSNVVTEELLHKLRVDKRCLIAQSVQFEEGASLYLDDGAKALSISDGVSIAKGAHIEVNRGASVTLRDNITIGRNSTIAAMCSIDIHEGVGIGNEVSIRDHNHRTNSTENITSSVKAPWFSGFESAPIVIESMAILSDGVRVMPGVRVGQNTLIGAGVHLRESVEPNCTIVGDASQVKKINVFSGPLAKTEPLTLRFNFFGDSLVDRPSIVVDDPHYDLPEVGETTVIRKHETAGFFKLVRDRLRIKHPESRFIFQSHAAGGSNIRDIDKQISACENINPFWDISFVCVGINDAMRKAQGRLDEAVDFYEYAQRYHGIINRLKSRSKMVFCIGESPVNVGGKTSDINQDLKEYVDLVKRLCLKYENDNVHFIDFFDRFSRVGEMLLAYNSEDSLWVDGVHYSSLGNTLAADIIIDYLGSEKIRKQLFREQRLERVESSNRIKV
ncbi:MAG: GDSL-type esterase/lipase family protein [Gammaproteobacteria bacterium]